MSDEIILGLLCHKLNLDLSHFEQHWGQTYAPYLEIWLRQNDHLDDLISVIAVALAKNELNVLLNPENSNRGHHYTEAFSRWIKLVSFIQRTKGHITHQILYKAIEFIVCHSSQNEITQEIIFSQLRKRLYLWNEPLEERETQCPLDEWLREHPTLLNQLISEMSKPLVEEELIILFSRADGKKTMLAKQFWEQLLHYLSTHDHPKIVQDIIYNIKFFLKQHENQSREHQEIVLPLHASPKNVLPQWIWQAPPQEREVHSESSCQNISLAHGFRVLAARIRGKKHKHEGSHCDDWFEIAGCGEWGIIAVADGAGSRMFSRIGARVACQEAIKHLSEKLHTHRLCSRETWSKDTFARHDKTYQFKEEDIEFIQQALHEAMQQAYQGIERAWEERDEFKYYYKALGNRDLTINDFATTLRLAVHTVIRLKDVAYSFVLTCQMGDGMTAAIYKNKPETSILSEIEKNNFSGETYFLTTSKRRLERNFLASKTFPLLSPLRALMVMTDGVSDDYFPPNQGMLKLLGDLILNGIIPISAPLPEITQLKPEEYMTLEDRIMETGPAPTPICSVTPYANMIHRSLEELIAHPAWLAAGVPQKIADRPLALEERLKIWLDTYHVRGSFDDRTLVILYNEKQ